MKTPAAGVNPLVKLVVISALILLFCAASWAQGTAPVADAGTSQITFLGRTVRLDGSKSTDPLGGLLQFQWSFISKPAGSNASFSDATAPLPTFVADKTGDYKIQLQVTNASSSSTSTVLVSTTTTTPLSNAGPDQLVAVGSTVQLDGSRSVDLDADTLVYAWSFVSVPSGSSAALSNASSVNPTFTADVAGTYVVKLTVSDTDNNHIDSTVNISTISIAPVSNAGTPQTVALGSAVHLDGSKSSDANNETLSYAWSFTWKPASSTASLANANTTTPSFVADAAGDYIAQLIVTNSSGASSASTVRISTQAVTPIANITAPQTAAIGTQIQLDGTKSVAFNGSSLTYKWWFVSKPSGSTAILTSSIQSTPKFTLDVAGAYVVALTVSDGTLTSAAATVLVVATAPQINIQPTSIPFGSQSVGTTSNSQSIALTNTGSANLVINSVTLGGPNYPEFAVSTPSLPATVTPGDSATLTVTFKPQSAGNKSATITIKDNVPGASPVIALTGVGAVPGISLAPTSVAFAAQLVGTVSNAQPVTITNTGAADLVITALTLNGTHKTEFSIDSITLPFTVPSGTNVVIGIRSAPQSTGNKSASLNIASNASSSSNVSLTGSGIAPAISIAPASVSFGNVNMGTSSAPSTITLWNTGTAPLTISGFSLTGSNPTEFSTNAPATVTIDPNKTSTITVTFSPQTAGSKTASLVLTDNTTAGTHQVALAGVGTLQGISISPATIDFLTQLVNTTSPAISVIVGNTGSTTLTLSSVALNGANAGDFNFTPPNGPVVIASHGSVSFPVSFAPGSQGKKVASIDVAYDGPQSPQSVPLKGTGVAPGFNLSASSLNFGDVAVNSTASHLVTVTNDGTANLTITKITLGGTDAGDFSISTSPLAITVNPGSSTTVGVTFKPTSGSGNRTATLSFTDNASGSPQQVTLSGNATAPGISVAPSSVDLGLSPVNVVSASKSVSITNTGNANLTISSMNLTGLNASEFAINPTTLQPVAPGAIATVDVTFTPRSSGARNATLTILNNAGPSQSVTLTGTGALPAISLAPGSLAFGSQPANTPTILPITVSNPGNANLLITKVEITGNDASQFSVPALGQSLIIAPNSNATINVTFNATTGGNKSASLVITDNVGSGTTSVPLTGSAVAPNIHFIPTAVTFSNTPVNTTSSQTSVLVQNTGTANLVISAIALSGQNSSDFNITSTTQLPITVTPGGSTNITLTFKPTATDVRSGSLDLTTNIPGGLQSVALSGTGTAPAISMSQTSVDFGDQLINTISSSSSITLTNTGTATLTISSIGKSGTNASEFNVSSPFLPTNISPNNSITVSVTLKPTSLGAKSATLTINDNTSAGTHTVTLTGNGVGPAISVAPGSLNFNNALVNVISSPLPVVVTNTGTANLSITSTSLTGTNGFEFTLGSITLPINIAPQGQATINVMAKPISVGTKSATLNLSSNAGPATVTLAAVGVTPGFSATPTSINFGVVQTNTSSNPVNVTVSNPGSAALVISNLGFSGTAGPEFGVSPSSPLPMSVQPGTTGTLTLTLNPVTAGFKSSTLTITDNAGNHTIAVSGNAAATVPKVAMSPDPLPFPSVAAGTSTSQSVLISNQGNATLSISSFNLSGTNSSEFSLSFGSTSVPVGGSTTATITFKPKTAGGKTATLTLNDNAPNSPHTLSITGSGIAPAASVGPSPVAFGTQVVGTPSSQSQVNISNTGSADLTITSLVLSGSNVADFTLTNPSGLPATVPPGTTMNVYLTFKPGGTGSRSALLTVNDNAPGSPQTVQINGTGIAPVFSITPFSLGFGNINANSDHKDMTLTVKNTGTADLVLSNLGLTGNNAAEFSVSPAAPVTISAGSSTTLTVTFTPTSTGTKSATLAITHNASATVQNIGLSGTGVAPSFTSSPLTVKFANQLVNTTSGSTSLSLTNNGNGPMTITAVQMTGPNAADFTFTQPNLPVTLNPFNSLSVPIKFTPTQMAQESASLQVTDSAPGSPHSVAISGTGIAAIFSASPTSLDFANQLVNTSSASQKVTVTNTGTASLSISKIAITGTNSTDFTVTPSFATTIAPNATATYNVTFKPGAFGNKSATLTFTDNASDSPQSIALTGNGISPGFSPSPSPVAFGAVLLNTTSNLNLVITNNGNSDLVITNAILGGVNGADFTLTPLTLPITVHVNETATASIAFHPTTMGNKTATLTFTDNAGTSPQSISITGTGAAPVVSVTPSSIFYPTQGANTTSNPTNVVIKNTGTANLVISSVEVQGSNPDDFTVSQVAPQTTVAPNTSITMTVSFTPQTAGSKSAQVVITDNASPSTQKITVSGTAIGPPITMGGTSVGASMETQAVAALAAAAPAGGVVLTVTSSNPSAILLSTTANAAGSSSIQVTVPAGLGLNGLGVPGFYVQAIGSVGTTSTLTASAPGYSKGSGVATVVRSGIVISSASGVGKDFSTTTLSQPPTLTLSLAQLDSTGAVVATGLLRGGATVDIAVASGTPATGTITGSPAVLSGGNSSTTVKFQPVAQGTSMISVTTPPGLTPATANHLTATVSQPHISLNPASVGFGLQVNGAGSLEAPAPSGGLSVTISSSDPSKVILSTDVSGTTAGSGSITVTVPAGMGVNGVGFPPFLIQGVASFGGATLTATASGFASGTATVNSTPSGFILRTSAGTGQPFSTTTLSANTVVTVLAEQLDASFNAIGQGVIAGGVTVSVPVSTHNTAGTIIGSPVSFHGGDLSKTVQFKPFTQGSDTVLVGTPSISGYSNASPSSQLAVTVTQPHITINSMTVGQNLQVSQFGSLDAAAPSGGLHVTITSPDPSILLSTSQLAVGSSSITLTIAANQGLNGTGFPTFWIQSTGSAGTVTLTATAPGFANGTAAITETPSTIVIAGPSGAGQPFTTNTHAPDTAITISTYQLDPSTNTAGQKQQMRAGVSITSTISSSNTGVGTIAGGTTATINQGSDTSNVVSFHAVAAGTTVIGGTVPSGFVAPSDGTNAITGTVSF